MAKAGYVKERAINLVADRSRRPRRARVGRRRFYGIAVGVLAIGVFIFLAIPTWGLVRHAQAGRAALEEAQTRVSEQKFREANDQLHRALEELQEAQRSLRVLSRVAWLPGFGRQVKATENLLTSGIEASGAVLTLSAEADRISQPFQQEGEVSLAAITPEEKKEILESLSSMEPTIQEARQKARAAVQSLEPIPSGGLIGPLAHAVQQAREKLPLLERGLEQSLPIVRYLPAMLGYPNPRTYLFLLQNTSELRPTGGFIGTYGVVTFKDGEITSFFTDNTYNLDEPAKDFLNVQPPPPLQKYLFAERWFLRDSNWSPDFPTSARNALRFYDLEKQAAQGLDGVIAVTPAFIASLLKVTGPVSVNGLEFSHENLVEVLEYQVQVGFYRQGIPTSERKEIIGILAETLFERLLTTPQSKWDELVTTVVDHVKQKHILAYANDPDEEALIQDVGWGGELRDRPGDFLMIVDANLASLKSDPGVKRSISITLVPDGTSLMANVQITYNNEGYFGWKTTRYRTYSRVYVPLGSELLESQGFLTNDKLHGGKAVGATTEEDLGRTVFVGFTAVEPQEQKTLLLKYRLPQSLAEAFNKGRYQFFIQKQAGADAHRFLLDIALPGPLQSYSPQEGMTEERDHLRYETQLSEDRRVEVSFTP